MGPVLRRLQKVERHQIMLMKTEKTRRAQDFIRGSLKKLRLGEIQFKKVKKNRNGQAMGEGEGGRPWRGIGGMVTVHVKVWL